MTTSAVPESESICTQLHRRREAAKRLPPIDDFGTRDPWADRMRREQPAVLWLIQHPRDHSTVLLRGRPRSTMVAVLEAADVAHVARWTDAGGWLLPASLAPDVEVAATRSGVLVRWRRRRKEATS